MGVSSSSGLNIIPKKKLPYALPKNLKKKQTVPLKKKLVRNSTAAKTLFHSHGMSTQTKFPDHFYQISVETKSKVVTPRKESKKVTPRIKKIMKRQ